MSSSPDTHVRFEHVTKRFGNTVALDGVDLSIRRGSVHAIVGENGAGKSTLGKLLLGVHRPDGGAVVVDGAAVDYHSPRQALADGLIGISQETALAPSLRAVDAVFLAREHARAGFVRSAEQMTAFAALAAQVRFTASARTAVRALSPADRKRLELMRAILRGAGLIVMDEPTAALTAQDTELLFDRVRALVAQGVTIVYISHFLDEVRMLADHITILRNGRLVRTSAASDETNASLVEGMLGRSLSTTFPEIPRPAPDADVVLRAAGVTNAAVTDISLEVRRGEVVALAGLVGSGRTEAARAIFGADRRTAGDVRVAGVAGSARRPRRSVRSGLSFLGEDRRGHGILRGRSIADNIVVGNPAPASTRGFMHRRAERELAVALCDRLEVRHAGVASPIEDLSGGNQQKVLLARCLLQSPDVLIVDEPTKGVDIGAKVAIYQQLAALAHDGKGILLISSEMEEVLGLAHRILVMRGGRIVDEVVNDRAAAVADRIARSAFGIPDETGVAA